MRLELPRSRDLVRNRLAWLAAAVFVLTFSPYVLPILSAEAMVDYGDTWADVPLIGLIVFVIFFRRPRAASDRERGFWAALGAGFAFWLVGRVSWGILFDLGLPVDLVADFVYLLLYVGILVALEMDPGRRSPSTFERRIRRYNIAGGVILLVTSYGYFALVPALLSPTRYESWVPAIIGSVVFDGYILTQLLFRYRSTADAHWRRVYGWMATAFALWVVTDALDVVWLYRPVEILDTGQPIDLLWFLPYVLFTVAMLIGRRHRGETAEPDVTRTTETTVGPVVRTPLVAYAFTLLLIHTALDLTGMLDPEMRSARGILLLLETVLLAGLIFKTNRMILRENRRLRQGYENVSSALKRANRELEERVCRRTAELEEVNRRLAADIRERVQVDQRLRATEARNRALIDAVPDALIVVDHGGTVRDFIPSRAGASDLVLSLGLGRPLIDLWPAESQEEISEALAHFRRGGEHSAVPIELEKQGETLFLELRFGRCGDGEILVLVQDVTERRKFELTLQQSQKLESLGIMAGGIAHDFNNLLTSILGNAQFAREILGSDVEVPEPLVAIETAAMRAAKLTGNLLAYAGEAHIEREPLDLARVFTDIESLLAAAVPKRARFEFDIGRDPFWVDGNEAQVTQILLNLVRNAAEALTGRGGSIRVELRRCRIPVTGLAGQVWYGKPGSGEHIRLQVRDTGCGMTPEVQQRIFDPFFTSKGKGRGLGLAAVLGIVSHHDAALTLESTPGAGTVFSVYFPACVEPADRRSDRPSAVGLQGSGTVLVADDEPCVRDLIARYLEMLGLTTVTAANGVEAVERVQAHRGHLAAIFMDYSMPEMNGAEAFRLIRRDDPEVPFIMLSGYGERDALGAITDDHRTVFLQKPFELAELASVLRESFGLLAKQGEA